MISPLESVIVVEYSTAEGSGKRKLRERNNRKEQPATIKHLLTSNNNFCLVTFCRNLLNLYGLIESASLASVYPL
jgi:hypothetical protein